MWNGIIGEYVKHMEKVLPITPWTSLDLSGEKGHDRERKETNNEMKHEQRTILEMKELQS